MADSIPKLRRLLNEAHERIRELEASAGVVEVVDVVKRVEIEVPGPERVVYVENPELIETIRSLQDQICQFTSQSDS